MALYYNVGDYMSDFRIGSTKISKVYFGSTEVKKIYFGNTKIFESDPLAALHAHTEQYEPDVIDMELEHQWDRDEYYPVYVHCTDPVDYHYYYSTISTSLGNSLQDSLTFVGSFDIYEGWGTFGLPDNTNEYYIIYHDAEEYFWLYKGTIS